jgi:hypothetical protein
MSRDGPQNQLEELIKESSGALGYPELVGLATDTGNSPNKAQSLAASRWPRRQAQATYSLAKLRRDFPEEFQKLVGKSSINPTEHARPLEQSGTEHARGERNEKRNNQRLSR